MQPDQKYIDALLNNDENELYELYRNCFPAVRRMIVQNNGSESAAADIFQECLIDLFRKAKTGKFILTSSVCAYLQGMCRNKWYDELQKQKRARVTFIDFNAHNIGEDSLYLSEEQHLKEARLDLVIKKFGELGKSCRDLLNLSWTKNINGKKRSTQEIADLLNVTNGYVRKKKSECIVKLIKLVMLAPEFKNLKP